MTGEKETAAGVKDPSASAAQASRELSALCREGPAPALQHSSCSSGSVAVCGPQAPWAQARKPIQLGGPSGKLRHHGCSRVAATVTSPI